MNRIRNPNENPEGIREKETHANIELTRKQFPVDAAQMASVGIMAGGLEHEVLQTMNAIIVAAESILFWHKRQPNVLPQTFINKIQFINNHAERLTRLISRVQFSEHHLDAKKNEISDLNGITLDAVELMNRKIQTHGINPVTNIQDDSMPVQGSSRLLRQIAANLINFAISHLDRIQSPDKCIQIATSRCENHAALSVSTDGFTQREPAKNVDIQDNLSLLVAETLIDTLNGLISVDEDDSGNVIATVTFPLINKDIE